MSTTSKVKFQPITAHIKDNLYCISQIEFELKSGIPLQSCLVHREKRDLCREYKTPHDSRFGQSRCHLVDDARTDAISSWRYTFYYTSAERTRQICKCYNLPGIRKLEAKLFEFLKNCIMFLQAKGTRSSSTGQVAGPLIKGKQ